MTNIEVESFINSVGKAKIVAFGFNNNKNLILNYRYAKTTTKRPSIDDISFVSVGDTDMIKVKRYDYNYKTIYYQYYLTEFLEHITVTENDDDMIDPMIFK